MTKKNNFTKEEVIELYKFHFPAQTKKSNEVLKKAFDDELIFVLRALDETSPTIIMEWIKENLFSATEEKLRGAFEIALAMKKFEDTRRVT